MRRQRMVVIIVILATLLMPLSVQAEALGALAGGGHGREPGCHLPESNAEALEILSNYYPGYWWDHTDLTVAVQAHPNARQAQLSAIDAAIETWSETLDNASTGSSH